MAKSSAGKTGVKTGSSARRTEVRRSLPRERSGWRAGLARGETWAGLIVAILLAASSSVVVWWGRQQPMAYENQIMRNTFAARVAFTVVDQEATRKARDLARQHAPRSYLENQAQVEALRAQLAGLPVAVADKQSAADVAPDLRRQYGLTDESIAVLRRYVNEKGEATGEWIRIVDTFVEESLRKFPLIADDQWQREQTMPSRTVVLRTGAGDTEEITDRSNLVNFSSEESMRRSMNSLLAPLPPDVRPIVWARLTGLGKPTFIFDEADTRRRAEAAASTVADVEVVHPAGEILHTRGDRLTADQLQLLTKEHERFLAGADPARMWTERGGVVGVVLLATGLLFGYTLLFNARILSKPGHLASVALLLTTMLAVSTVGTATSPSAFIALAAGPTLLFGIIMLVAYGQRYALGAGSILALLVCFAIQQSVGLVAVLCAGLGAAVWQLREIRDRNRLVRAGLVTGIVLAIGATVAAMVDRPPVEGFLRATMIDAMGGAGAGAAVGILALGLLSPIERVFNVITGMTLVELRDPKQPLLRELQQRAPGTWNHSLQVANLAESAAEAIGADSLLTYVGSLYHDIGKMNKPAYFVENQSEGPSRHQKLRPAMSLLIIVGHVKDGVEMAREYGLPKPVRHFIESHHGTTLVEYFYHAAKEKAESGETRDQVSEVEYRYPGPKPRTKEAAIVMLSDAVESAARALSEPIPSRIEQLVRAIAQKRLLDHQFDDCDLTLKELRIIEDSLIKSLCAIHHGRIAYPSESRREETPEPARTRGTTQQAVGA